MITGNEPAMPFTAATENELLSSHLIGLTIREHFAAIAMQGMLSNPKIIIDVLSDHKGSGLKQILEIIALDAIDAADVLIAELNKPV